MKSATTRRVELALLAVAALWGAGLSARAQDPSAIVAKELKALGFAVTEGIGKTGVVGVLKSGPGPTVGYRADMDSNSVRETTGLPSAAKARQRLAGGSEIDVMPACGHDAHVTWRLGMAKTMVALKADWSGTLVVYGQPAEEVGLGAQAVLADQTIVSRNIDPQSSAVLTVGSIATGRDNNVIHDHAVLKLNLRWFSPEMREQMLKRIDEISNGVAQAAGGGPDRMPTRLMKGSSGPLVNDKALVARINPSLKALVGDGKVLHLAAMPIGAKVNSVASLSILATQP